MAVEEAIIADQSYLNGIAAGRVGACYLVICLHCFPLAVGESGFPTDIFLGALCRGAVPFFFATSGYLFALKRGTHGFDRKYSFKLLQLAIFWMIVGILTKLSLGTLESPDSPRAIAGFIYQTFLGGGYHHLWFLCSLFYINAWISFVAGKFSIFTATNLSIILYVIGLAGGIYSPLTGLNIPGTPRDFIWFGSLPYCIGWLMATRPRFSGTLAIGIIITIISITLHLISAGERASSIDYVESTFGIGIGFLMVSLHVRIGGWIRRVAKHTLGIYCIHGILLGFYYHWFKFDAGPPAWAFLIPAVIYFLCYNICGLFANTIFSRFIG